MHHESHPTWNASSAWRLGIAAIALTVIPAAAASAAVITTTTTIDAHTSIRNSGYETATASGWYANRTPFTGLQKFNPALGTLTGVALTANFDYTYESSLQPAVILDTSQPHEATATFDQPSFRFLIGYEPDTTTTVLAGSPSLPVDPLTLSGNAGDTLAGVIFSHSGTVSANLVDITSLVDLTHFVGSDDVDTIIIAHYHPYSAVLEVSNLGGTWVETVGERTAGSITLHYTYNAIPEPAAISLLVAGLPLLLRRRSTI